MKADNPGRMAFFDMAFNGVANIDTQFLQRLRFGENRLAQGPRSKAAFGRLFDQKYQFVHFLCASSPLILPIISAIRLSFSRILSTNCSGGKCAMSSFACGFLRSRLQLLFRSSATGTFHACSFSLRLADHAIAPANSSNCIGAVFV